LCEIISGLYYEIVSSRETGEKSQIVCIKNRSGVTPIDIAKHLEDQNIIISPRNDRIRIAPHFFNTPAEIEKLVENLP